MIYDIEQGSDEWRKMRRGRWTASEAYLLLTSPRKAAERFLLRALGHEWGGNAHTDYGHEAEPVAADWWRAKHGVEPRKCGFAVMDDSPLIGCSPDRLVMIRGGDAVLEIKCPSTRGLPEEPDPKHVAQVQWQLGVLGLTEGILLYWVPDPAGVEFRVPAAPEVFREMVETALALDAGIRAAGSLEEALLEAQGGRRSDAAWQAATMAWMEAKDALEAATAAEEEARDALVALADGQYAAGCGVQVSQVERAGAVDWRGLAKRLGATREQEEAARKPASRYALVTRTKGGSDGRGDGAA